MRALEPEEVYEAVLPSVLTLQVEARNGSRFVGTAVLALEPGVAVTAWHLVQDARTVQAHYADGTPCEIVGVLDRDEVKDVALLRLANTNRPANRLCRETPRVGSRAYAIGAPKGYEFSISEGILSQVQVEDDFQQYQVSCAISPGNSGGPVVNAQGEIIGIVTWSKKEAQNLNFATPAHALESLNPKATPVLWNALAKSSLARRKGTPTREERDRLRIERNAGGYPEMQQFLRSVAGKRVSTTIVVGGKQQMFTFTAPEDAGK